MSRQYSPQWQRNLNRHNPRLYLLGAILCSGARGICLRLVYLQVFRYGNFEQRAQHQQQRTIDVSARRGIIYDRAGHELAMSIAVDSVFAVPAEMPDLAGTISLISRITKDDPRELLARCEAAQDLLLGGAQSRSPKSRSAFAPSICAACTFRRNRSVSIPRANSQPRFSATLAWTTPA